MSQSFSLNSLLCFGFSFRLIILSPGVFIILKSEKSVSLVRVLTILIYVSGLKTFSLSVRKVIRIFYRRKCRRSTSRWSGSPSVGRSCHRWRSSVSSVPQDLMEISKWSVSRSDCQMLKSMLEYVKVC